MRNMALSLVSVFILLVASLSFAAISGYAEIHPASSELNNSTFMQASNSTSTPPWVSKGAYVNYTVTMNSIDLKTHKRQSSTGFYYEKIFSINRSNSSFTFNLSFSFNLTGNTTYYNSTSSYLGSPEFPAFTPVQMQDMKSGNYSAVQNPTGYRVESVSDVNLRIGGADISAYKVSEYLKLNYTTIYSDFTQWVDKNSGLVVQSSSELIMPGSNFSYQNLTLKATNIINIQEGGNLYLLIGLAIIVAGIITATVFVYRYRFGNEKDDKAEVAEDDQINISGGKSVAARMDELKSMLDSGVITEEFYQESLKQLQQKKG